MAFESTIKLGITLKVFAAELTENNATKKKKKLLRQKVRSSSDAVPIETVRRAQGSFYFN